MRRSADQAPENSEIVAARSKWPRFLTMPEEMVSLHPLPERPLVSIIIPSFNQGRFIRATIDSILGQSYRPIEIVVIDGKSEDCTIDVLRSYRGSRELTWVSESDRGVADAVNKGLQRASGDILAIQSSDDYYLPGGVGAVRDAFAAHPQAGLVFGDIVTVNAAGDELHRSAFPQFTLERWLSKQLYIPQPSAFFRREMREAIGGWDDRYFVADTQYWLRMVFRTEVVKIDSVLSARRLHEEQRNLQSGRIFASYRQMIADSAEIATASRRLQRAARAGVQMHAIKYCPAESDFVRSCRVWRALWSFPGLWPHVRGSAYLFPGRLQARIALSKCKQWLRRRFLGLSPEAPQQ